MTAPMRISPPDVAPPARNRLVPAGPTAATRAAGSVLPSRLARCLEIEQFLLRAGWGENGCAAWDPAGTPVAALPPPLPRSP